MIYRKLVSEDTGFSKLFSFAMLELAKFRGEVLCPLPHKTITAVKTKMHDHAEKYSAKLWIMQYVFNIHAKMCLLCGGLEEIGNFYVHMLSCKTFQMAQNLIITSF